MLKRSTDDGMGGEDQTTSSEGDGQLKKRRIQFEAVRMPAVSNVNDMRGRALAVQAVKMRQLVLVKSRELEHITAERDKVIARHKSDESNFTKVYNIFSEILSIEKFVHWQTQSEYGPYASSDDVPSGVSVLTLIADKNFDQFQSKIRHNLENAFHSYSKARQERAAEVTRAIKNMKSICESPHGASEAFNRELAHQATQLAEQNEKLMDQNTTRLNEAFSAERKRRQMADKLEAANAKAAELSNRLDEALFNNEKQQRQIAKLELRLEMIAKREQTALESDGAGPATPTNSGENQRKSVAPVTPPQEVSTRELDTLRAEREDLSELASRRLQELEEMQEKMQAIAAENTKLKLDLQKASVVSVDQVQNCDEYKTMKNYYSIAVREYERIKSENKELIEERNACKQLSEQRFYQLQDEQEKTLQEIRKESAAFKLFYDTTHDIEILRTEFDIAAQESVKQTKQVEWDEMKGSMNEMRHFNSTLRNECKRLRVKHKAAREEITKLKGEVDELRTRQDNSILVPIAHASEVQASPSDDIHSLRVERQSLIQQVQKLGAADKKHRQEMIQREVERRLGDKLKEIETLKQANETLTNDEQQISEEMEGIEERMSELQQRNEQLRIEMRAQDERNLRVINDRMIQESHIQALTDRVNIAETRANTSDQVNQITQFEKTSLSKACADLTEIITFKNGELNRAAHLLEQARLKNAELGKTSEECVQKAEKAVAQLQKMESVCQSKTAETHEMSYLKNRLQEELDLLKKQYERSKRAETQLADSGSDEVLKEANRQLKETLTCPSCKTRPKDCIMLKCYHLFCETCIKTMYDTRQRKCPKCNSGFGANDFHRVFI